MANTTSPASVHDDTRPGQSPIARDRRLVDSAISLRHRLPWLDGKMPGGYESQESSSSLGNPSSNGDPPRSAVPERRITSPPVRRPGGHALGSVASPPASNISSDRQSALTRAITDLEELMREAVQLATDATEHRQIEAPPSTTYESRIPPPRPPDTFPAEAVPNLRGSESDYRDADASDEADSPTAFPMEKIHTLPLNVKLQPPYKRPKSERGELISPMRDGAYLRSDDMELSDEVRSPLDRSPNRHNAQRASKRIAPQRFVKPPERGASRLEGANPWLRQRGHARPDHEEEARRREALANVSRDHGKDDFNTMHGKRYDRAADLPDKDQGPRPRHRLGFQSHHVRRRRNARKWNDLRKRLTATIACISTAYAGMLIGVYAGEVPKIQYQIVDPHHFIILGNVMLFVGLTITSFLLWPLPLLHGRKPYTLGALAVILPLQFPQAVFVSAVRSPNDVSFHAGLLLARFFTGLFLGAANINFLTTLFDLFGASLQSANPHQELVFLDDIRRQGGGMGIWLGIWSWCFIGSISLGFLIGAVIIANLNPAWGFYITCIVGVAVLMLNVIVPETRKSPYRRSFTEYIDKEEKARRRIARGEAKLHLESHGPLWWGQEMQAGIRLNLKMLSQSGFAILALYMGWIYAQVVLVIVLLGSLLSREYHWRPQHVGFGVFAIAVGALLAVPMTKAGLFSRQRTQGPRTDSMTFERQLTWTSHMARRLLFMLVLPIAGVAYTLTSPGGSLHASLPILFAGCIGFFSNLGLAECVGLVMETFDTSDLQPGINSRHRLKSMASDVKRRRTNYSSFPRVTAGIFVSQSIGFLFAAAATGVGGVMTRTLGSQTATAATAAVLLVLTVLLTAVLWRYRKVQVIPHHAFGTRRNTAASEGGIMWDAPTDEYWKPVIIGNPSGKTRSMNLLELGRMSRWTEIRELNGLVAANDGPAYQRNWTAG